MSGDRAKKRGGVTGTAQRLAMAIEPRLLPWFSAHRRAMPWRTRRTPYRVWISEIMLQQTRVDTVRPYFNRFMKRFPSVRALAEAPLQDVLKLWEGLGYYSRARNVHRCAHLLTAKHGGRFPRTYDSLCSLPGIGPYTAAAIGSLAMGLHVPVLDGNVMRILTRLTACADDIRKPATQRHLLGVAETLLVPGRAGETNEAMMELGALVCLPRNPRCTVCPLRDVCQALSLGDPEGYPVKTPKAKVPHRHVGAGVVVDHQGRILVAQRRTDAMLGGLWEFPGGGREDGESMPDCIRRELREELGIHVRMGPHLCTVPHAFTHFTMELHAYWARIERGRPRAIECADYRWCAPAEIRQLPLPRADIRILERIEKEKIPTF